MSYFTTRDGTHIYYKDWGSDDQIVPIVSAAMVSSKLVKGAQLKVYEGAPHGLPSTLKDRLNDDLLSFLTANRGLTSAAS